MVSTQSWLILVITIFSFVAFPQFKFYNSSQLVQFWLARLMYVAGHKKGRISWQHDSCCSFEVLISITVVCHTVLPCCSNGPTSEHVLISVWVPLNSTLPSASSNQASECEVLPCFLWLPSAKVTTYHTPLDPLPSGWRHIECALIGNTGYIHSSQQCAPNIDYATIFRWHHTVLYWSQSTI